MQYVEKIINATVYDKETSDEIMDLPIEASIDIGFNQEFPTWIIAYCPDISVFFITNKRYFFWEYDKEFATEEEGIKYFEKHVNKFIDIENRIKNEIMLRRFVDPSNTSVFLENTGKNYRKIKD